MAVWPALQMWLLGERYGASAEEGSVALMADLRGDDRLSGGVRRETEAGRAVRS